jgi:hypothetical protein
MRNSCIQESAAGLPMRRMLHKRVGLALLTLLPLANGAIAGFDAHGGAGSWLEIRSDEPESDALLRLGCKGFGLIDTHLGGVADIGKGGHEAVSVTLSSGKLTARVQGASISSEDSELTGGIELLTALMPDDKAFSVLTSGKEIKLQVGSGKAENFTLGAKTTAALKAFLKKCG